MRPLLAFLTPFFFVITGAKIDLGVFASGAALTTLLVVTVIAVVSKIVGGFIGALSLGTRGAAIVGIGMVPRGEVGIVIASLGLASGVFSDEIYAVIVAMSLLTSIVTPPVLAWMLKRDAEKTESPSRSA
jgi:Kef-type K+ transport system membrane component KefB